MGVRSDALLAAARFISAMPELGRRTGPVSVVMTGRIRVGPGGTNQVPALAEVTVDFRDPVREWVLDIRSGAGHDSRNMALPALTGMIFGPSRAARSHSAAEYTAPEDVVAGADVLLATLLELAEA